MNLMVFNFLSIVHYSITLPHRRVVLLCAEKRGRFIPCRGGGTNSTYYSDAHDVDEDKMTGSVHGGDWEGRVWIGIAGRNMPGDGSITHDNVASRLIYLS